MAIDDSFKKPGAIPFKREIRPGVPKHQQAMERSTLLEQKQKLDNDSRPSRPLLKLGPPPGGFSFPSLEHETQVRVSEVDPSIMTGPEIVESGCFMSSLVNHMDDKKKSVKFKYKPDMKLKHGSDIVALPRFYESTHEPLSSFSNSRSSSSFSSYQSSPCLFSDPEWVGFGLF